MMKTLMAVMLFSLLANSCATVKEWGDKAMFWQDDKDSSKAEGSSPQESQSAKTFREPDGEFVNGVTPKAMELKQAKIWARLDELENEVRIQRAHIKVLQKGMKLGIVPEELLTGKYEIESSRPVVAAKPKRSSDSSGSDVKPMVVVEDSEQTGTQEDFKRLMSEGETHFRAGHYGKAIAAYEKVGRLYSAFDKQFSHRYWAALCWYRLKELEVAKDQFENFVKSAESSPWVPRAEFYLARIDIENGMLQSALKGFRGIVKKYPYDDTSEMAQMEIDRIEQRL